MDSKLYTKLALKTANHDFQGIKERLVDEKKLMLLHAFMGLSTEANEVLDMMKKHVYYGKEFDRVNVLEEIGDTFWYCALALDMLGSSFEEVMDLNIKKLQKRYNGKFTPEAAINRDVETERKILENKE